MVSRCNYKRTNIQCSAFLLGLLLLLETIVFTESFSTKDTIIRRRIDTTTPNNNYNNNNNKKGLSAAWSRDLGESALGQVQNLASLYNKANSRQVVRSKLASTTSSRKNRSNNNNNNNQDDKVAGTGGNIFGGSNTIDGETDVDGNPTDPQTQNLVTAALASLERDMQMLDTVTGKKAQLSPVEFALLSLSVAAAASGPMINLHLTEFVAPAAAAFSASIGIGAEYIGKVAVADGKETAATTIQCAAEAEGLLANAERAKAVTPLCVGIGATAAPFALLAPILTETLGITGNTQLVTELYLFCPLVSVLAAAVASLALQETKSFASQATSVGNRRFAQSGLVGRTWLSSTQLIERKSSGVSSKWKSFSYSVLPAPIIGALVPGPLPTKAIVVAAFAAAQSAYFLAQAEYCLARATDAVALKARSAAVCDTYANQGARSAAVLPFTSALASLCAAATAAIVELPFLESMAATGGPAGLAGQIILVSAFPAFSSMFAAAASVSKARCQVDAKAATEAASTLALEYETDDENDPVLRPFRGVTELIRLTALSTIFDPLRKRTRGLAKRFRAVRATLKMWNWIVSKISSSSGDGGDESSSSSAQQQQSSTVATA